jgi:D-sedoheptulose 7-phosphate isomerase
VVTRRPLDGKRRSDDAAPLDGRHPAGARAAAEHVEALTGTLAALHAEADRLARWGWMLAERLGRGHRLLVAGNGGSAAEAQHFTAELVGRFSEDRRPFSAIALHGDTSSLTAIGNDYGYEEVYARQVTAHARPGDIVALLSTSGCSGNLLAAVTAAHQAGATCWAVTGPAPNPLAAAADDALCLPGATASIQEGHLVALHAICVAFEAALPGAGSAPGFYGDEVIPSLADVDELLPRLR